MIRADNCIFFGEELAAVYDETRPFRRQNSSSPILQEICGRLTMSEAREGCIRVLDVGSGTGRITIPLANHYAVLADQIDNPPKLEIYCVEKSSQMLKRLQDKLEENELENVVITGISPQDIRDIPDSVQPFDAVIAHWVFHVISDWRVALYKIERLLRPTAKIFLLSEQSDLYRAIDGDYRDIVDGAVHNLWDSYHRKRSKIALELSAGAPVLPPRFRLGSMVVDDRVEQMFRALGWNNCEEFEANNSDEWVTLMRLDTLINRVIRLRAYTNMRLLPQEALARQEYEKLADQLLEELSPGEQQHNWRITTSLTARVLTRTVVNGEQDVSYSLLLHVLRDTLGRRWKRRKEHAYNRNALWRRLFTNVWIRLNSDKRGPKPLGALGEKISETIICIYTCAPFAGVAEGSLYELSSICKTSEKPCIASVWADLTGAIETHDPLCFHFLGRELASTPSKSTSSSQQPPIPMIHPHIHTIDISIQDEKLLLSVPIPLENEQSTKALDALIPLRTGELSGLVERARQIGFVPFHDRDAQTRFLLGLAKIAHCSAASFVYTFPFRADFQRSDAETLGMCICSKAPLPESACEFLWTLNDIVFNEYLEDILADMELHLHEEAAQSQGPATVRVTSRTPVSPERWAGAESPAILLVVSTRIELETLIDLAGVRDSLDKRRRRVGRSSVIRHELGFEKIPVWAVSTARAGSGTAGGSLSTVLTALSQLRNKPYAVIMPGIAFGLQKRKQRLGDILVSDRICTYEMQKLIPRIKIDRGLKPTATPELLRLFQSCELNWATETPEVERPTIDYGLMMSGEKLVNDPEFVAELLDAEPEALGGEMEAAGLYAGTLEFSTRWIMVKAICDWGMGKGDKFQKLAARNSIGFLFHILQESAIPEAIKEDCPALLETRDIIQS